MKTLIPPFSVFYQPGIGSDRHAQRRSQFLAKLPPNSVVFFVAPSVKARTDSDEYKYRQSSNILYLSGFPEPEAVLMLTNIKDEPIFTMFVQPQDKEQEVWTGKREGVEGAKLIFGANAAFAIDQLADECKKTMSKAKHIYFRPGSDPSVDATLNKLWLHTEKSLLNPETILNEMRLIKDADELKLMQTAADISAKAHCLAMQNCAAGMDEGQLEAYLEFVFAYLGAPDTAYGSIVAGGNNATTLHYTKNNCLLGYASLVLVDAACEYKGYASDITRTFPINGKFLPAQREIYEIVLAAQKAAIAVIKPGVRLSKVHDTAKRVLAKGLIKLGILPASALAALKTEPQTGEDKSLTLDAFYMHGTSHWLGLDVHDVGDYKLNEQTLAKNRILQEGMVITVEPGLYFDRDDARVPLAYRTIGVRIEDDVVVTKTGYEVITAGVPKEVSEIEALMSKAATLTVSNLQAM